jgi:hypothetical protein
MSNILSLVLGTGGTAVLVGGAAVGVGHLRFRRQVGTEVAALLERGRTASRKIVRADDLAGLPPPVHRWLMRANVVGRPRPGLVHLTPTGNMRGEPDQQRITWQTIDNLAARAKLEYRGTRASATFMIDENGPYCGRRRSGTERNRESTRCVPGRFRSPNTANSREPGCPSLETRSGVSTAATWRITAGGSPA